jgi:hypothetical protein
MLIIFQASNNVVSHSKRAVMTAVTVSFGGVGGILATTIFRQQDFPLYRLGIIITISSQGVLLLLLCLTTLHFWLHNKKIHRASADQVDGRSEFLFTL